jgi:hypothetical protein
MKRVVLAALLGVSACVSLSCDRVLGIPERSLDSHIACADGECVCLADFGDCDDNLDNGCESDTRSSSTNCGACGHDCLGGGCVEGSCQPVAIPSLVEGIGAFALMDGIVYAFRGHPEGSPAVLRVDVRGPMPAVLEPQATESHFYNAELRPGTGALLLCDHTNIHGLSLETWAATLLFENVNGHIASCSAGGGMAWWLFDNHEVAPVAQKLYRSPENGAGSAVAVQTMAEYVEFPVFADDQGAYLWDSAATSLRRYSHGGGAAVPVSNAPKFGGFVLASDAKNLYYYAYEDIGTVLYAVPRDGGDALRLAQLSEGVSNGTSDARYVYFEDSSRGTVSRVPLEGGEEEVIATGQSLHGRQPLHVDERAVYWLANYAVWRLAK